MEKSGPAFSALEGDTLIYHRGCAIRLRRNTQRACANRTSWRPDEAETRVSELLDPFGFDTMVAVQRTGLRQKRAPALECSPARAQSATTSIS